jgi:hypothetical protein
MTVNAYGKKWQFDLKKYCGYIKCDRIKKVMPISHIAVPFETKKGISFMCDSCGNHTDDDYYYHVLFYKGKEIKYEHND